MSDAGEDEVEAQPQVQVKHIPQCELNSQYNLPVRAEKFRCAGCKLPHSVMLRVSEVLPLCSTGAVS